jgi:hypothetical protein
MRWLAGLALVGAIIAVVAGISSDLSFLPLVGVAVFGAIAGAAIGGEVVGLVRELLEGLARSPWMGRGSSPVPSPRSAGSVDDPLRLIAMGSPPPLPRGHWGRWAGGIAPPGTTPAVVPPAMDSAAVWKPDIWSVAPRPSPLARQRDCDGIATRHIWPFPTQGHIVDVDWRGLDCASACC